MSLNLYTYCYNRPIKFIDPSGHDAIRHENEWGSVYWEFTNLNISVYEAGRRTFMREGESKSLWENGMKELTGYNISYVDACSGERQQITDENGNYWNS